MKKFQIDFSDGIPLNGKININANDKDGKQLFIGDTIVDSRNEKYVIGYRYGNICLIPPFGVHTLEVKDYSNYIKTNECTVIMGKYLIIGFENEKFFEDNSKLITKISRIIEKN